MAQRRPKRHGIHGEQHAHHLDFGAAHARYVDAFFDNVRWDEVDRRLVRARKAHAALR